MKTIDIKAMKADLAVLEEEFTQLVKIVDEKRENRMVDCYTVPDYERKMWVQYRSDTSEEIGTEPMSDRDLQENIQFGTSYFAPETGEDITNKIEDN